MFGDSIVVWFFGMAQTTKVTITLKDEQLQEVQALVAAGEAASLSGFVQRAVNIALHDSAGWRDMLDEAIERTGGPLTKTEKDWADAMLSTPKRKRRPRNRKAA